MMARAGAAAAAAKSTQKKNPGRSGRISSKTGGFATSLHSAVSDQADQAAEDGKPNAFAEFRAAQEQDEEPALRLYLDEEPGVVVDLVAVRSNALLCFILILVSSTCEGVGRRRKHQKH